MADCTGALQNDGRFVVVRETRGFDGGQINGGHPQPCLERRAPFPKRSFSSCSRGNAAVRRAAFRLLRLTLTDSSELICSTSSAWRCFFSVSRSFDVLNITINNVFRIKINRFAALSCSLHPRADACINQD